MCDCPPWCWSGPLSWVGDVLAAVIGGESSHLSPPGQSAPSVLSLSVPCLGPVSAALSHWSRSACPNLLPALHRLKFVKLWPRPVLFPFTQFSSSFEKFPKSFPFSKFPAMPVPWTPNFLSQCAGGGVVMRFPDLDSYNSASFLTLPAGWVFLVDFLGVCTFLGVVGVLGFLATFFFKIFLCLSFLAEKQSSWVSFSNFFLKISTSLGVFFKSFKSTFFPKSTKLKCCWGLPPPGLPNW